MLGRKPGIVRHARTGVDGAGTRDRRGEMRLHRQLPTDCPVPRPSLCTGTAIVIRGDSDLEQALGCTEALGSALGRSVTVIAIASMHWMVRSGLSAPG